MKRNEQIFAVVKQTIDEADPIQLLEIGCPEDEYDPEIKRIVAGLPNCKSVHATQSLIHSVFVEMFDETMAGDFDNYRESAIKIHEQLVARK